MGAGGGKDRGGTAAGLINKMAACCVRVVTVGWVGPAADAAGSHCCPGAVTGGVAAIVTKNEEQ